MWTKNSSRANSTVSHICRRFLKVAAGPRTTLVQDHFPGAGSCHPPWCISARTPPPALGRHHQALHHLPPPSCCWCMPNMHNYQETCPPSARPCLSFAAQFFTRFPAFTAAQADMRGMRGMRRGPSLRFSPKTKNHLVRGLRREGWIMSRKKGAG